MLLNLSNHPSPKWNILQRQTAIEQYGKICDMPFPNIPPHNDIEEVNELAQVYLQKILQLQKAHPKLTVHLMGELTFTFALLQLLQKQGIPCVASTSDRMSAEGKDGTKVIRFEFVQFRAYFQL